MIVGNGKCNLTKITAEDLAKTATAAQTERAAYFNTPAPRTQVKVIGEAPAWYAERKDEIDELGKQAYADWSNAIDDKVLSNYKAMDHAGCPGPTTSAFIAAHALEKYGKVIDSATDDYIGSTMNDAYSAHVGSFIKDLHNDENGNPAVEVIYSATTAELLAEQPTE